MPGRSYTSQSYRYGFNGMERDDEVAGSGNSYTALFWQYDSRLGRRWNRDPKPNPSISNYAAFSNNPIFFTDVLGDTVKVFSGALNTEGGEWKEGQERLYLYSLDDGNKAIENVTFNSDRYKEINPQWDAENLDNYMAMTDLNTSAFLDYGAGALLTPTQLRDFIRTSNIRLENSSSFKNFGWGNLAKWNNYNHGEQGDIKADGNLLDGTHLTLYNPFGAKPTLVRSDLIGNFVYGAISELHGQRFSESRSDGNFLQSGGTDDQVDSYFLLLGHRAMRARTIPSSFNKRATLPAE